MPTRVVTSDLLWPGEAGPEEWEALAERSAADGRHGVAAAAYERAAGMLPPCERRERLLALSAEHAAVDASHRRRLLSW